MCAGPCGAVTNAYAEACWITGVINPRATSHKQPDGGMISSVYLKLRLSVAHRQHLPPPTVTVLLCNSHMESNRIAMSLQQHDVLDVIEKIRGLKYNVPEDEALRRQLRDAVQELSLVLETPLETVRRISFSVMKFHTMKLQSSY